LLTSRAAKLIAGKVGYGVTCLVAAVTLVTSFYAHKVVADIDATGKGIAISGSPSVGAMNILVMGLESRTNFEGQVLPESLLVAMHAGNAAEVAAGQEASQDTDTLILIHIFAGGQKAVGFSIPRDDLVTYPSATYEGVTQGKIDGAYAFAYDQYVQDNVGKMSNNALYLGANRAGQAFEIATVQAVTGVHIDHFVETNLAGFYYLAQAFNGIEVCITPAPAEDGLTAGANLQDLGMINSGWNALADGYNLKQGGPQYLHLAADQALAYVRDRDSLPEIDLDRTHRQQAVLDYVIWALKHENYFTDLGKLTSLLSIASQYVITDSTFNLLDFATNMRALTGSHVTFTTLPIVSEADIELNGSMQDVNNIDVPYIQQEVKNAFYPSPPPSPASVKKASATAAATPAPSSITVNVYNGGSTPGLAGDVSQALDGLGYKTGTPADASAQSQPVLTGTQVFYGAGASANAANIATEFGTTATALPSLPADSVEVLLGSASASVPAGLSSPSGTASPSTQSAGATAIGAQASASASATPSPAATNAANDGQSGGAVTVSSNAKYGVPCVY
jgi:LCP family protein required for cell wall assembly